MMNSAEIKAELTRISNLRREAMVDLELAERLSKASANVASFNKEYDQLLAALSKAQAEESVQDRKARAGRYRNMTVTGVGEGDSVVRRQFVVNYQQWPMTHT